MTLVDKCKGSWHMDPVFIAEMNSVICLACEKLVGGRLMSDEKVAALIARLKKDKRRYQKQNGK